MKGAAALFSSAWANWSTPRPILDAIGDVHPIGLDPCTSPAADTGALLQLIGTTPRCTKCWSELQRFETGYLHANIPDDARGLIRPADWHQRSASGGGCVEWFFGGTRHVALPTTGPDLHAGRYCLWRDGLAASWAESARRYLPSGVGCVFVNPPYGPGVIEAWVRKCAEEAQYVPVFALVPARVDTAWFHDNLFATACALVSIRGRLRFGNPPPGGRPTTATFPSTVAYWGPSVAAVSERFRALGHVEIIRRRPAALPDARPLRVLAGAAAAAGDE